MATSFGDRAPISTHPAFATIVAVWSAALLGFGTLILPATAGRWTVAAVAALVGALIGFVVARRFATAQARVRDDDRALAAVRRRPLNISEEFRRAESPPGEPLDHGPMPTFGGDEPVDESDAEVPLVPEAEELDEAPIAAAPPELEEELAADEPEESPVPPVALPDDGDDEGAEGEDEGGANEANFGSLLGMRASRPPGEAAPVAPEPAGPAPLEPDPAATWRRFDPPGEADEQAASRQPELSDADAALRAALATLQKLNGTV